MSAPVFSFSEWSVVYTALERYHYHLGQGGGLTELARQKKRDSQRVIDGMMKKVRKSLLEDTQGIPRKIVTAETPPSVVVKEEMDNPEE